ncbi:hypothetical protein [Hanstruepera marina]|uniref:hypothetical protein n=1 Tax=Hanstruepera marina TaxID=2873265 RepID=UPI001CA75AF1|nr:hypothetical protein [Hanstruepera marina]
MRKLVVLLFSLFALSCSIDDDNERVYNVILPVEDAVVPTEFERGEVYDIYLKYFRPTSCYAYNDVYYVREGNERMVAVVNTVFEGDYECVEVNELLDTQFSFKAGEEDSYVFKFWQGEDDNGDSQYLIIEVPVVD